VRSCKAPYYCPSCNTEVEVLVEASDLPPEGVPTKHCDHCGSEMELNELEEFFSFLR
jgi:hypothetical protein